MPKGVYKRRPRVCKCGESNPEKFYSYSGRECKVCVRARTSKYQTGNSAFNRKRHLRRAYNWTPEKYDAELEKQHGLCALCGKPPAVGEILRVDHNHETGETRGLIHQHCNSLLGFAREDTAILLAAIDYVVRYKKN
jgi:Recombination endonuclease VII